MGEGPSRKDQLLDLGGGENAVLDDRLDRRRRQPLLDGVGKIELR
jgi:hypothetical protein